MNTIIWHDSGIDVCQQDTMVLYVKDTGTDDVTSKLAMAGCAINKINQHLENYELSAIPWIDFTKHWTDEMLYEHFKLTPEEIAWVEALPAHPRRSDPV